MAEASAIRAMSSAAIRSWEKQCARELSRAGQRKVSHTGVHRAVQEVIRFYPALTGDEYTEKYWNAVALHLKGQVSSEGAAKVVLTEFLSIPRNRPGRLFWAIRQGNQDLVTTCLREKCIPGPQHLAAAVQVDPSLKLFKMLVRAQGAARKMAEKKPWDEEGLKSELAGAPQPVSQVLGIRPPQPMANLWLTEGGVNAVEYLLSQSWITADSRTLEAALHARGVRAWKMVEILMGAKATLDQSCLRAALSNEEISVSALNEWIIRGQVRIGHFDPQTITALLACPPDRIFATLQALLERGESLRQEDFLEILALDMPLEECIQFCQLVVPSYLPPSSALLTMVLKRYNEMRQTHLESHLSSEDCARLITPWIRVYGVQSQEMGLLFSELLEESLLESRSEAGIPLSNTLWIREYSVQSQETGISFSKPLKEAPAESSSKDRRSFLETVYLGMPDALRSGVLEGLQTRLSNGSQVSLERHELLDLHAQLLWIDPQSPKRPLRGGKNASIQFMRSDSDLPSEVMQRNATSFMRAASEPPPEVLREHILPFVKGWAREKGEVSSLARGLWKLLFPDEGRAGRAWSTFRWVEVAHTIADLGIAEGDLKSLRQVMVEVVRSEAGGLTLDQAVERMTLVAKLTATVCLKEAGETILQAGERAQKGLLELLEGLLPRAQEIVGRQLELFWDRCAPRSEYPPIGTVSEAYELAARLLDAKSSPSRYGEGRSPVDSFFDRSYEELWQLMMERAAQDPECPIEFLLEMLRSESPLRNDDLWETVQQCVVAAMLSGNRGRVEALLSSQAVQSCLTDSLVVEENPRFEDVLRGLLLALNTLPRGPLQRVLEQDGEWLVDLLIRHGAPYSTCYDMLATTLPSNTPRLVRRLIDGEEALDRPTMRRLTTAVLEARDLETLQLLPAIELLDAVEPHVEKRRSHSMSGETIRSIFSFPADAAFRARWLRFLEEDLRMVHTTSSLRALVSVAGETLDVSKLAEDMLRLSDASLERENPLTDAPDALITRLVHRLSTSSSPPDLDLLPYVTQAAFERASPLHESWLPHIMQAMKCQRGSSIYPPRCHQMALQAAIRSQQRPLLDFVEKIAQALSSVHDSVVSRLWASFERLRSRLFGSAEDRSVVLRAAISTYSLERLRWLIKPAIFRAITTDPTSPVFQDMQLILNTLTEEYSEPVATLLWCMMDCMQQPLPGAIPSSSIALPGLGELLSGWRRRGQHHSMEDHICESPAVVQWLVGRREGVEWLLQSAPEALQNTCKPGGVSYNNGIWDLRGSFLNGFQNWEEAQPILKILRAWGAIWIDAELLRAAWWRWDAKSLEKLMMWLHKLGRDMPSEGVWMPDAWGRGYGFPLNSLRHGRVPSMLLDTTRTVQELHEQLKADRERLLQARISLDEQKSIGERQLIATLEWARRRGCSIEEILSLLAIVIPNNHWLPVDADRIEKLIQAVWRNCSVKATIDVLELLIRRGLRPSIGTIERMMIPIELYPLCVEQRLEDGDGELSNNRLKPLFWIEGKQENGLNPEVIRLLRPPQWAMSRRVLRITMAPGDFCFVLNHPGPTTPAIIRILAEAGLRSTSKDLAHALEVVLNHRIDPRYAGDLLRSLTRGLDGKIIAGAQWNPEQHASLMVRILDAEHIPDSIKRVIQRLYEKGIEHQPR